MMDIEYIKITEMPPYVNLVSEKRISNEQFLKAYNFLLKKFDKVIPHQCIEYKEVGKKETFCAPDFICSNKKEVWIIDAKKIPATSKKMDMYQELIRWYMDKNHDNRIVQKEHFYLFLLDNL